MSKIFIGAMNFAYEINFRRTMNFAYVVLFTYFAAGVFGISGGTKSQVAAVGLLVQFEPTARNVYSVRTATLIGCSKIVTAAENILNQNNGGGAYIELDPTVAVHFIIRNTNAARHTADRHIDDYDGEHVLVTHFNLFPSIDLNNFWSDYNHNIAIGHLRRPVTDVEPMGLGGPLVATDIGKALRIVAYGSTDHSQGGVGTQRTAVQRLQALGNDVLLFSDPNIALTSTASHVAACITDAGGAVVRPNGHLAAVIGGFLTASELQGAPLCVGEAQAARIDRYLDFINSDKNDVNNVETTGCAGATKPVCYGERLLRTCVNGALRYTPCAAMDPLYICGRFPPGDDCGYMNFAPSKTANLDTFDFPYYNNRLGGRLHWGVRSTIARSALHIESAKPGSWWLTELTANGKTGTNYAASGVQSIRFKVRSAVAVTIKARLVDGDDSGNLQLTNTSPAQTIHVPASKAFTTVTVGLIYDLPGAFQLVFPHGVAATLDIADIKYVL